ncbi:hypothetical protein Zmor_010114 [Zophobas morio]|uniref:CHK kinase-like domain-containing protein n=1 Tax=Zophobas morio TaxID=2755281 RepID=A0AA38MJC2_9CUCU|nr:hypothetical protein Zmor_010114 [Zophobas morio]
MNVERIEKLKDILPLDENKTIIDHQVKRLTAPGENFGGLMLSVDITVQNVYGSFQHPDDVIFFLFSSVQNNVLDKHYDNLVRYYHQTFTSILQKLKCETTRFSFDALLKEIDYEAANSQFMHLMFMTFIIFTRKGTVKELSEITPDDLMPESGEITDLHKEKLIFVIRQFAKHNWI